jgi:hypothetical protein
MDQRIRGGTYIFHLGICLEMVKRLLILILIILPTLLCLSGCDLVVTVLTLSPFPGYLSQAVAAVDLTGEIEQFIGAGGELGRGDIHVLKNDSTGKEYVFLIVRRDSGGQRVYAFDTSLELITQGEIDFQSNLSLVDANGDFVVGDVRFYGDPLTSQSYYPNIGYNWDYAFGVAAGSNYLLNSTSFDISYNRFSNTWTSPSYPLTPLGAPTEMRLKGIGYDPKVFDPDPLVPGNPVYLFLHGGQQDNDEGFLQIVWTPASDYSTTLSSPVFGMYPVQPRVDGVRGDGDIFYTRKGVVAQTRNRGRYYLLTLGGEIQKQFQVSSDEEIPLDFDIDGDYYYVFDERNYRLYKANTGF